MKKNVFGRVLSALCFVCLVILLTFFIVEYVGQYTEVEGMSMYPTLKNKENLILDKVTYRFQDPKRYDIIVFPPQYKENTYYIKRIIGLPGEEAMIRNGEVYIDGKKLKDDCGYEIRERRDHERDRERDHGCRGRGSRDCGDRSCRG